MNVLALVLTALLAAAPPTLPDIEDEVMCVVCGTALNVSSADSAEQQREFIRRRIDEGMTKQEIKDALVAEYGPGVLAVPEPEGTDLGVYVVPGLLVLLGLGAAAVVVRRGRREPEAPEAQPDLDAGDAARLDADLAAFDR